MNCCRWFDLIGYWYECSCRWAMGDFLAIITRMMMWFVPQMLMQKPENSHANQIHYKNVVFDQPHKYDGFSEDLATSIMCEYTMYMRCRQSLVLVLQLVSFCFPIQSENILRMCEWLVYVWLNKGKKKKQTIQPHRLTTYRHCVRTRIFGSHNMHMWMCTANIFWTVRDRGYWTPCAYCIG